MRILGVVKHALTHCSLGDFNTIFLDKQFSSQYWWLMAQVSPVKLPSDECHWALMIKPTLVQVMAWCRQATSHYLSQCWPRSMLPYGIIRPQWVNSSVPGRSKCDFENAIFNLVLLNGIFRFLYDSALRWMPMWPYWWSFWSTLVQVMLLMCSVSIQAISITNAVMACHLFSAKPLTTPMLQHTVNSNLRTKLQ